MRCFKRYDKISDRAENASAQVEVDDLHRVRAIFRTSDYSGPKRNSKRHCGMWTNPFLPSAFWARGPVSLRSRGSDERHARFV